MNKNRGNISGIVLIVAVLLVIGGYLLYAKQTGRAPFNNGPVVVTPTPTPTVTPPGTPPSPAQRQPGVPVAVTNPTVAPTDTTAVVTGSVVPNGVFTAYWYEYGLTSALGTKTLNQNVGSGYMTIPAPAYITGLTSSRTYYFRLVAENTYGRVSGAQYTFQTIKGTPAPVGTAALVKTLAATGISRNSANLDGEITPNGASTQQWFEYGTTANLGNITPFVAVGNGVAKVSTSASVSNLDPLTTYYFRLNGQNQFGTVNGAILNFKTIGPAAATAPIVSSLAATSLGTTKAKLRGTVDPNGTATTYWFEYGTDPLFGLTLLKTTPKKSAGSGLVPMNVEADVTGLSAATTYYFRTVAENSVGTVDGAKETFKTR